MAKDKEDDRAGIFIPAGAVIGMGVGFLLDQFFAGLMIGVGIGFVVYGIMQYVQPKKK